jgi:hypothetical protein
MDKLVPNASRLPQGGALHPYDVARAMLAARGPDDRGLGSQRLVDCLERIGVSDRAAMWSELPAEAEHNGVAPIIEPIVAALAREHDGLVPDETRRAFLALASRHRRATLARQECTDRLLAAFAAADIPVLLLKGAALMHLLYPRPELRPMADVDVLVSRSRLERAAGAARGCGFRFAEAYASRFTGRHHHLPVATASHAGFSVALEIHDDAISHDQAETLTFETLHDAPRRFSRGDGPDGFALGHTDMLRHLTRHAFEPAQRIRLIHLYDLWRYPTIFGHEIDWQTLRSRFPQVLVALRLVQYVFAADDQFHPSLRSSSRPVAAPAGIGMGMIPLSEIAAAPMRPTDKLAALLNPPAWWLHGFYGVPPEASLLGCRLGRHPATVVRWLARRMSAAMFSSSASAMESGRSAA